MSGWIICTEHDRIIKEKDCGSCPECNGDRNLLHVAPINTMLEWKNLDPRSELWGKKRANIIILRSNFNVGWGEVEMKNGWSILTSFNNPTLIGENDRWDTDWKWILAPDIK